MSTEPTIRVLLVEDNEDNLAVCQIARRMFQIPRTIALVNDPENEEVFRQMGVSVPFSSTQIIARILEERAGFEEVTSLIPVAEGRITVSEVSLRPDAPAAIHAVPRQMPRLACRGNNDWKSVAARQRRGGVRRYLSRHGKSRRNCRATVRRAVPRHPSRSPAPVFRSLLPSDANPAREVVPAGATGRRCQALV